MTILELLEQADETLKKVIEKEVSGPGGSFVDRKHFLKARNKVQEAISEVLQTQ